MSKSTKTKTSPISCGSNPFREEDQIYHFSINKKLVCFDWDGTLSIGNSYNSAIDYGLIPYRESAGLIVNGVYPGYWKKNIHYKGEHINNFIQGFYLDKQKAFNGADNILENIGKLIDEDINVAILSYNKFPEIIAYGLKIIGFSVDQISKIHVICGFPKGNYSKVGKMEHIKKAKELCEIDNNANVILVEDSEVNITIAEKQGIKCYHVTKDTVSTFMKDVVEMIQPKETDSFPEIVFKFHPPFTATVADKEEMELTTTKPIDNNILCKREVGSHLSPKTSEIDEQESEGSSQILSSGSDLIFPIEEIFNVSDEAQSVASSKEISGASEEIQPDFV